ncbi:GFA family protein [Vibrio sp. ZSDZ65]|uniref:GFA family protein n=1 Tax=Vibrio qingdaonensis TaxID=2829491 RepID=A0A9X3HZB9_9VIBR|nr:GFA family protein [Vibrio qingdaonensis]MCW8349178.1 GFA family protein [Vibrio qingdaonensis]
MEYPLEGSCQCGEVHYKLYDAPLAVFACHCTECQKLSTSPFSVTAVIDSSKIEFEGKLSSWERIAESGNRNQARFCSSCGNRVYHFNPDELSTVKLKLKPINLKDESIFEPKAHVWVSEKLGWYELPEGVKVFPKQPK